MVDSPDSADIDSSSSDSCSSPSPPDGRKTKKRNYAVALHYGKGDEAPRILAAGPGEIAKKILEIAEAKGVPIQRDEGLLEVLSKIQVGATIPHECYRAVAEIFAFLFRMDIAWRQKKLKDYPDFYSG